MRQRTIKPTFFTNEDLAALSPMTRLVFIGVWSASDRFGRAEDRPARLKVQIAPFDKIDMHQALQDLHDAGFITRYEIDGSKYIQVNAFHEHQRPHPHEPSLNIPPPQSLTSPPRHVTASHDMSRRAVTNCPGSSGSSLTGSSGSSDPPTPVAPQNGAPRALLLAEFQTFYTAYPGPKTAKKKAEEKFLRARKAGVALAVLLESLARQEAARRAKTARGEWVPEWCNPATWLNQRRWEDETEPVAAAAPGPQLSRGEWLLRLQEMRARNRPAFEHVIHSWPAQERAELERELDALPALVTEENTA